MRKSIFTYLLAVSLSQAEYRIPMSEDAELQWWRDSMVDLDVRMEWWDVARFGMFVHWGAYSPLEGFWQGESKHNYSEQIMKHSKISIPVYKEEVVAKFNPVNFDADAWVQLAVDAGMKYIVLTAKHHDGFAIWDSATTDYDIMDATPFGRDPIAELKAACDKRGINLGLYYSQALDWHHPQGTGNDWDYDYPVKRDWWMEDVPHRDAVTTNVDEKAIPQVLELIEKYDVDLIWFDTPIHLPPHENIRILKAAREAKPDLIVSSRIYFHRILGDYLTTTDLPINFAPHDGYWEAVPSVNHSYGFHRGDNDYYSPEHFIVMLAKAASKGGNTLLNVGPRGDGQIGPIASGILRKV